MPPCRSRVPRSSATTFVRIARSRELGVGLEETANDFGIHFTTLCSRMTKTDIEDGERRGTTEVQSVELREAKRGMRTLEQEVEVLHRAAAYFS